MFYLLYWNIFNITHLRVDLVWTFVLCDLILAKVRWMNGNLKAMEIKCPQLKNPSSIDNFELLYSSV